jgi:hypothetical protein
MKSRLIKTTCVVVAFFAMTVPLSVCADKNTSQITVVNTPTINVQQTGKWIVGLNDTPTVKVSSPVVAITQGGSQAADVYMPFVKTISFNIETGTTQNNVGITIPEGKRLVIEYVSARAQGPAGQKFIAQIQTSVTKAESPRGVYWLVFFPQGTFSTIDVYTASQPMRIFADPSTPPALFVATRTGITGTAFVEATISGYLVNFR